MLKTTDDRMRPVTVVGTAYDLQKASASFTGQASGYIDADTLEWLGGGQGFDRLLIVATGTQDEMTSHAYMNTLAQSLIDKIEKSDNRVNWSRVPPPGEHDFQRYLGPMLLILGVMGILSLMLSGFLVINIISAILAQQVRQIGVMKTIGGQGGQIAALYLVMVTIYGVLALAVAMPLGMWGAQALADYCASLMNFDLASSVLTPKVIVVQSLTAVAVPLLASLVPILRGANISVREAVSDFGVGTGGKADWVEIVLSRIHFLSRPQLLSLRNTFRRKARLTLTLLTLILASATFIGVASVRSSLLLTLEDAIAYWNYDISLDFSRLYRVKQLTNEAATVTGVTAAEGWSFHRTIRLRADDTESERLLMVGLPADSKMIRPILLQGRWLRPGEQNGVVVNTEVTNLEPDIKVGGTLTLKVNERESDWHVVGLVRSALGGPVLYGDYDNVASETRTVGKAATIQVQTDSTVPQRHNEVATALETHFKNRGIGVTSMSLTWETRETSEAQFTILIFFLAIMAVIMAIVGGLGLMGTMSINVLERRREIGIMRAIGASNWQVTWIVLQEGLIIGTISWLAGVLLAIPLSKALSDAVGLGLLKSELSYTFSVEGALLWLVIILVIAGLSSWMPARQASQLTVREVLAYE